MRNVSLDPPPGPEYACLIISNWEITFKETVSLRANVEEDEVDEYCGDHHDIKSRDLVDHAPTALGVIGGVAPGAKLASRRLGDSGGELGDGLGQFLRSL